ncbi:DUF4097 domain-containing protein [bacterium]|nr:DUF4097 domain-containing protein [bacterium]
MPRRTLVIALLLAVPCMLLAAESEVVWEKSGDYWTATETSFFGLGDRPVISVDECSAKIVVIGEEREDTKLVLVYHAASRLDESSAQTEFEELHPNLEIATNSLSMKGRMLDLEFATRTAWFEMTFYTPFHTNTELITTGGDLLLKNLAGEMRLESNGGTVTLDGTSGRLILSTSGGDVFLKKHCGLQSVNSAGGRVELDGDEGIIDLDTAGGDITLNMACGRMNISSWGGDITLNDVKAERLKVQTSGGQIIMRRSEIIEISNLESRGGDILVEDCTGNLDFNVSGGDLEIHQHLGDVDVFGSAGNITIDGIAGDLDIDLTAGSVFATLSEDLPDPVRWDLQVNAGDVEVSLYESVQTDLVVRLNCSRNQDAIQSDFPLDVRDFGGSIAARGQVNGGGSEIDITVGGGKIRIRKN